MEFFAFALGRWLGAIFLPSLPLPIVEIGVNQSTHELRSGALHPLNLVVQAIRSATIKVGRNANVLLWRSGVQG